MERGERKKRILSVFILLCFVTFVSCFSAGRSGEGVPDERAAAGAETGGNGERMPDEGAAGAERAGKDAVSASAGTETDLREADEREKTEEAEGDFAEEDEPVFGRGIESEKSLSEDVLLALKNGDTKSLIGVALGEEFDYGVYKAIGYDIEGRDRYRPKEIVFDWRLEYFFEGEGHRFSGFSINDAEEPFLGVRFRKDIASMFSDAFGEPDVCEKLIGWGETEWDGRGLRGEWYFEKAVLAVEEYGGVVTGIEYQALGNAADAVEKTKSDLELRMEKRSEYDMAEDVFEFYDWETNERDTGYPGTDHDSSAGSEREFVEDFLREQGFGGQSPDSTIYDEKGEKFAEGYIDAKRGKFCFVIYKAYNDRTVYCAARDAGREDERERLVYRCDEQGNVTQETLYDVWGMRMAEASYNYHDGISFPFIAENWNLGYEGYVEHLCRNQKTWFYEKDLEPGQTGSVKAVSNDDANIKSYFHYPSYFSYRPDGKLKEIQEEIPEDRFEEELLDIREHYFGEMEFEYDENGILKKVDYGRSPYFYGSGDQSGTIDFDEQGRMVHSNYYITSGCHDNFYFYLENEKRPWAVIDWCYGIWSVDVYTPAEE